MLAGCRSNVTGLIHAWIAFDIHRGWLLTQRAQAHFAVSFNHCSIGLISSFLSSYHEKAAEALLKTNPDSLRNCLCFRIFRLNFASDFFNLLLAGFHQAEIIIVKHLIQGRNNETRLVVEPSTLRSWSS